MNVNIAYPQDAWTPVMAQIMMESNAPPNQCAKTFRGWKCPNAVTRNLNGTWSTVCLKHKHPFRSRTQTKDIATNTMDQNDLSSIEEEEEVGKCEDCSMATSMYKNGKAYKKYCDDCNDTNTAIYRSIHTLKNAKRTLDTMLEGQNMEDLVEERHILRQRILEIDNIFCISAQAKVDYDKAKKNFDTFACLL